MMKRLLFLVVLILSGYSTSFAATQTSDKVVYIGGKKYYIHTISQGETLYGLSKSYSVSEESILELNPSLSEGFKLGEVIKVPVMQEAQESLSARKLRRTFNFHTVIKGETLYGIAQEYEVPIRTIMDDNPNTDPIKLRLGERLLIRKAQIGDSNESANEQEWEQYRNDLNSVTEQGSKYEIVKPGETIYSLARRYDVSEQELSDANNGLKAQDLKAGMMVQIPNKVVETATVEPQTAVDSLTKDGYSSDADVRFTPLGRTQTLNVALLLPIERTNGRLNDSFNDFYKGFLMGLEDIKQKHGYSVDLNLFNASDSTDIEQILANESFRHADLIVGPIYENQLPRVVEYAEAMNIPVVSPLADLSSTSSPALFQMAPSQENRYEKAVELLLRPKITLIYTSTTDKEFEQEVMKMIGDSPHTKVHYDLTMSNKTQRAGTTSDLTPTLQGKEEHLILVMSDSELDLDRVFAALSSASSSIKARSQSLTPFRVFGNTKWSRYDNIDRTGFFKNFVTMFSNYHAKRDSYTILNFDREYIAAFSSLPSLYSYRGYDAAKIFVPAMYNDIQYNMQGLSYSPLQTTYRFVKREGSNGYINNNWMRVNYNDNFTINVD